MVSAYIEGVGLWAPGLYGWAHAAPWLLRSLPDSREAPPYPASALLPPAERRRAVPLVRLAFVGLEEALLHAGIAPETTATVFASSGSDGTTLDALLSTLAERPEEVSPTRFHNAVHNAAAGYWSIAVKCQAPSTSLAGFDDSFSVGLLEALATVAERDAPVALSAYEMPYPEPLHSARPMEGAVSVGLVLCPSPSAKSLCRVDVDLVAKESATSIAPALEPLRAGNSAARALPCLLACAEKKASRVVLDYPGGRSLEVTLSPC